MQASRELMTESRSLDDAADRSANTNKPVLFIGHEASATGAPYVLLHFLEWLRGHTTINFEILLLDGGPLVGQFGRLGPTTVLRRQHGVRTGAANADTSPYDWPADLSTRY